MKVLFQARINLLKAPGGDTIQILKTKEYLEKIGLQVDLDISLNKNISYNNYDLVHLFNVTRIQETYWYAKNAKAANKPILLSTIYWDNSEFEKKGDLGFRSLINKFVSVNSIEFLKTFARMLVQREFNKATFTLLIKGFKNLQKETTKYIDHFLPNAKIEMDMFHKSFSPNKKLPFTVIPNAVTVKTKISSKFNQKNLKSDFKDCILCVGRIDPRKNQLNLVKALKNTHYKVVFIGKPAPNHSSYMSKIKKEATENMFFLGWMDNDKINDFYKLAKVHVCPSWFETPGLVSLEAVALGCNIVVTDKGSTIEYFGNEAFYCKPDSVKSIKNAVDLAFNSPKPLKLQKKVLNNYNWDATAQKTLEAYNLVLNNK
jgi:glycosyltransferase involved in cell wall biosynthesis